MTNEDGLIKDAPAYHMRPHQVVNLLRNIRNNVKDLQTAQETADDPNCAHPPLGQWLKDVLRDAQSIVSCAEALLAEEQRSANKS